MELAGKKVIALGERDGVPGNAIADCVRSAGAEVVLAETEFGQDLERLCAEPLGRMAHLGGGPVVEHGVIDHGHRRTARARARDGHQ